MVRKSKSLVGIFFGGIILAACLLTGCKRESMNSELIKLDDKQSIELGEQIDATLFPWKSMPKEEGDNDYDEILWNISGYKGQISPFLAGTRLTRCFSSNEKDHIYLLTESTDLSQEIVGDYANSEYYLSIYNTCTEQLESHRLQLDILETENVEADSLKNAVLENHVMVTGFDVSDSCQFIFMYTWVTDGKQDYYAAELDKDGNIVHVLNLLHNSEDIGFYLSNPSLPDCARCDQKGNFYLLDDRQILFQFDENGKFLNKYETVTEQCPLIEYLGKMLDGLPIYACMDSRQKKVFLFTIRENKVIVLYEGKELFAEKMFVDEFGTCYYFSQNDLYQWNVKTGENMVIYHDELVEPLCIGMNSDREIYILGIERGDVVALTINNIPQERKKISIAQACKSSGEYLNECVTEYSRMHPNVEIEILEVDWDNENWFQILASDMVQDHGPDMLVVERENMINLVEMNVLTDVESVIEQDVEDNVPAEVIDYGRVNGTLFGITNQATVETLLVSDNIWKEDQWSIADILNIMEQDNSPEYVFTDMNYNISYNTLRYLLLHIDNSGMLVGNNGYENFDTEKLKRVLEICKQCGKMEKASDDNGDYELEIQKMKEQRALTLYFTGDFVEYSRIRSLLGEGFHSVGFPTENEMNSYYKFYDGCVVVNSKTKEIDVINDFLRYTLTYTAQRKSLHDVVRKDVLIDSVVEGVDVFGDGRKGAAIQTGVASYMPVASKKDGLSYLKDYLQLFQSCKTDKLKSEDIQMIMLEEADLYFNDDKKVENVIDCIQRRINMIFAEE